MRAMSIILKDDKHHAGQLPAERRIGFGNTHCRPFSRVDADPIRSYRCAWYRQPDKIVAVLCTVGILAVTSAIFWGWL